MTWVLSLVLLVGGPFKIVVGGYRVWLCDQYVRGFNQEPSNVMLGRLGFGDGWVAKNVWINGKYPINHTISATSQFVYRVL